jgi:hypothetical protein
MAKKESQEPHIILNEGEPWQTAEDAEAALAAMGLNHDTNEVVAIEQGGYAIEGDGKKNPPVKPWVEEYWVVIFSPKSSPNDTDDVELMVNGETLLIQREKEVPVPGRFLECADHGFYEKFSQEPGKSRKVTGKVHYYPYTRIRQTTKEEFDRLHKAGTKLARQHINRYGFDVTPDQVSE